MSTDLLCLSFEKCCDTRLRSKFLNQSNMECFVFVTMSFKTTKAVHKLTGFKDNM